MICDSKLSAVRVTTLGDCSTSCSSHATRFAKAVKLARDNSVSDDLIKQAEAANTAAGNTRATQAEDKKRQAAVARANPKSELHREMFTVADTLGSKYYARDTGGTTTNRFKEAKDLDFASPNFRQGKDLPEEMINGKPGKGYLNHKSELPTSMVGMSSFDVHQTTFGSQLAQSQHENRSSRKTYSKRDTKS